MQSCTTSSTNLMPEPTRTSGTGLLAVLGHWLPQVNPFLTGTVITGSSTAATTSVAPTVTSVIPAGGVRGMTVRVTLSGTDLEGASVAFVGTGLTIQSPITNPFNVSRNGDTYSLGLSGAGP